MKYSRSHPDILKTYLIVCDDCGNWYDGDPANVSNQSKAIEVFKRNGWIIKKNGEWMCPYCSEGTRRYGDRDYRY
jgi:DNA-directed RNA polymerase subunit RPC12/RpoP